MLVLLGRRPAVGVGEVRRGEQRDVLIAEARGRVEAVDLTPLAGLLADLLDQLALGELQQRLVRAVALAGWDLQRALTRAASRG